MAGAQERKIKEIKKSAGEAVAARICRLRSLAMDESRKSQPEQQQHINPGSFLMPTRHSVSHSSFGVFCVYLAKFRTRGSCDGGHQETSGKAGLTTFRAGGRKDSRESSKDEVINRLRGLNIAVSYCPLLD